MPYIETYKINGLTLHIEDLQDLQESGPRYQCWFSGCGVGGGAVETLDEARRILYDSIIVDINYKIAEHQKALTQAQAALTRLKSDDPARILQFITDQPAQEEQCQKQS